MRQPLESCSQLQNRNSFTNASSAPAQNTHSSRPPSHSHHKRCSNLFLFLIAEDRLDHETLDLVLESADLVVQVAGLVGRDASRNDGAADTAGTAESHLAGNVDVGDVCGKSESAHAPIS